MIEHVLTRTCGRRRSPPLSRRLRRPEAGTDEGGPLLADRSGRTQEGVASHHGARGAGQPTASGERLRLGDLTAASRTLPIGTEAKVTNTDTGKSVNVRVSDRGPYVQGRVVDVTSRAADALG